MSDDNEPSTLVPVTQTPCTPAPRHRSATAPPRQPARKGPHRRKKQAPVANSEESFIHVEAQPQSEDVFASSVGGEELRNIRRRQEEDDETSSFGAALSVAAVAQLVLPSYQDSLLVALLDDLQWEKELPGDHLDLKGHRLLGYCPGHLEGYLQGRPHLGHYQDNEVLLSPIRLSL